MILALDLGSTTFKAAVMDRRLREIRFGSRPVYYRYAGGGRVEMPVARMVTALREAIADALGKDGTSIQAVAITSQAQTFTLTDTGGRPQMPFVSWRDGRREAMAAAERLRRKLPDFAEHAGFGEVLSALQIAQLAALGPGATDYPVLLPAYVLRLLTGAVCVDDNQAAMTGLYSLQTGGWRPRARRACGLTAAQLPPIIPVGTVAAETGRGARRFGLRPGIPVVLAGNDQSAGAYGAKIERRGDILLTLGTAIAVYACSRTLPPPAPKRVRGPYPGGGYYRMTTDSCGGALINWAQTLLAGCVNDDAFFAAVAQSPPGSRGLRFEPSEQTGGGDWRGGGPEHRPDDFARALLETVSRRTAGCLADLGLTTTPQTLRAAGGGSRRPVWLKMISEASAVPHVTATQSTPMKGAARMAIAHIIKKPVTTTHRSAPNTV